MICNVIILKEEKKMIHQIDFWNEDLIEFKKATQQFYNGEITKNEYKGISGGFGSYAQKGGKTGMVRLRLGGGRITKEKLAFIADMIEKYNIDKVHLTTCQTIQLHNLHADAIYEIVEQAFTHGIITMGGGGDFPRNVMSSPLSGVQTDEYFDVLPYAETAGEYLLTFIKKEKMPRKLKVGFSNGPDNITHATYRDLGFAAREDGTFDVYSAGGLGNQPRLGICVAQKVDPSEILYYIYAMRDLFLTYGNYELRSKARTRFMRDILGDDGYISAFHEKLALAYDTQGDMHISPITVIIDKSGDGSVVKDKRVIPQKQDELYTVSYHPIGGCPSPALFRTLSNAIHGIDCAEIRLSPDADLYILNLTGSEANTMLKLTTEGASSPFETSVACIGSSICQGGIRDSQALLQSAIHAVREAGLKESCLPQIHISGCQSSCGTHQTGDIGFHGGVKTIDKVPHSTFTLHIRGCQIQGQERLGDSLGMIEETDIPAFLVEVGKSVDAQNQTFKKWNQEHPDSLEEIARKYINA